MGDVSSNFSLTGDLLAKARIGLWAIEVVEGEEPRMYADATMCKLLAIEEGLAPELVYHAWYDHVHPDHYGEVAEAVDQMIAGNHAEVQYPWNNPKTGETYVRCGGIRNMDFTRGIRIEGCHQDISETYHYQKQAERTAQENQFLAQIIRALPLPVFIKSAEDFSYCLCNNEFASLLGRKVENLHGLKSRDVVSEDYAKLFRNHDRAALAANGKTVYFHDIRFGDQNTPADSRRTWDKWECCVDGGRGKRYLVGALQDITAFKVAAAKRDEFFANVSHDIRTPLNAIIGFSRLLKDEGLTEAQRTTYLDNITFSGETLLDVINQVLDLSKLEADKMVFTPERCDFRSLAQGVVSAVAVNASPENVALRLESFEQIPPVDIDAKRVRQVLFNLVGNAAKFTERGEVLLSTAFEKTTSTHGKLLFSVRDTGIGISKEDLKTVFEPYTQGTSRGNIRGTGLGLAICRRLVRAMNGTISAYSELGKGSTFTVILNDVPYHAETEAVSRPQHEGNVPATIDTKTRILAVDDTQLNLMVMKAMLEQLGITDITLASGGHEALEKLTAAPDRYDMVFTDMRMPAMDGDELLAHIRANKALSRIKVYAVTADITISAETEQRSFDGIILKPVTPDSLKKVLATSSTQEGPST